MKTLIILLISIASFTSCKKCVTCSGNIHNESFTYRSENPDYKYNYSKSDVPYEMTECGISNSEKKGMEKGSTVTTITMIGYHTFQTTTVTTSCDCK